MHTYFRPDGLREIFPLRSVEAQHGRGRRIACARDNDPSEARTWRKAICQFLVNCVEFRSPLSSRYALDECVFGFAEPPLETRPTQRSQLPSAMTKAFDWVGVVASGSPDADALPSSLLRSLWRCDRLLAPRRIDASFPWFQKQSIAVLAGGGSTRRFLRGWGALEFRGSVPRTFHRGASRGSLAPAGRRLRARSTRSASGEIAFAGLRPRSDATAPNSPAWTSNNSPGSRPTAEWRACFPLSIRSAGAVQAVAFRARSVARKIRNAMVPG